MPTPSPDIAVLQRLHEAGQQLAAALDAGDFDAAAERARARGALVAELNAHPQPETPDAAWVGLVRALQRQGTALADRFAQQERELAGALAEADRHRRAQHRYATAAPRPGRLREVNG